MVIEASVVPVDEIFPDQGLIAGTILHRPVEIPYLQVPELPRNILRGLGISRHPLLGVKAHGLEGICLLRPLIFGDWKGLERRLLLKGEVVVPAICHGQSLTALRIVIYLKFLVAEFVHIFAYSGLFIEALGLETLVKVLVFLRYLLRNLLLFALCLLPGARLCILLGLLFELSRIENDLVRDIFGIDLEIIDYHGLIEILIYRLEVVVELHRTLVYELILHGVKDPHGGLLVISLCYLIFPALYLRALSRLPEDLVKVPAARHFLSLLGVQEDVVGALQQALIGRYAYGVEIKFFAILIQDIIVAAVLLTALFRVKYRKALVLPAGDQIVISEIGDSLYVHIPEFLNHIALGVKEAHKGLFRGLNIQKGIALHAVLEGKGHGNGYLLSVHHSHLIQGLCHVLKGRRLTPLIRILIHGPQIQGIVEDVLRRQAVIGGRGRSDSRNAACASRIFPKHGAAGQGRSQNKQRQHFEKFFHKITPTKTRRHIETPAGSLILQFPGAAS